MVAHPAQSVNFERVARSPTLTAALSRCTVTNRSESFYPPHAFGGCEAASGQPQLFHPSDLLEPIRIARREFGLKVGLACPHRRPSHVLAHEVDFVRTIRRGALSASQLPDSRRRERDLLEAGRLVVNKLGQARALPPLPTAQITHSLMLGSAVSRSGGMADAGDSKSPAPCGCEGSTPSSGTNGINGLTLRGRNRRYSPRAPAAGRPLGPPPGVTSASMGLMPFARRPGLVADDRMTLWRRSPRS